MVTASASQRFHPNSLSSIMAMPTENTFTMARGISRYHPIRLSASACLGLVSFRGTRVLPVRHKFPRSLARSSLPQSREAVRAVMLSIAVDEFKSYLHSSSVRESTIKEAFDQASALLSFRHHTYL